MLTSGMLGQNPQQLYTGISGTPYNSYFKHRIPSFTGSASIAFRGLQEYSDASCSIGKWIHSADPHLADIIAPSKYVSLHISVSCITYLLPFSGLGVVWNPEAPRFLTLYCRFRTSIGLNRL